MTAAVTHADPADPAYPFVKVSLHAPAPGGMSCHTREDDPDVRAMVAEGWTLSRRWEVTGPKTARELPTALPFTCSTCGRPARLVEHGVEHTDVAPHPNGIHVPTVDA